MFGLFDLDGEKYDCQSCIRMRCHMTVLCPSTKLKDNAATFFFVTCTNRSSDAVSAKA